MKKSFTPLFLKNYPKPYLGRAGFTFIEFLISALILSSIVAGVLAILSIGQKSWDDNSGLLDLQQQTRAAVNGMVNEVRQAAVVAPPSNNGSRIDFTIPVDITPVYSQGIAYYLCNNTYPCNLCNNCIIREHPAGNLKIIANDIDSLSFSLIGTRILQIQVQAKKTVKQRLITFPQEVLTEKVRLRNAN